jgi:hypothetical protein
MGGQRCSVELDVKRNVDDGDWQRPDILLRHGGRSLRHSQAPRIVIGDEFVVQPASSASRATLESTRNTYALGFSVSLARPT